MSKRVARKRSANGKPLGQWQKPMIERMTAASAETGIDNGPEILILIS